jgi:hypothetical protein
MSANTRSTGGQGCRRWSPGIAALAIAVGSAAFAQVVSVPAAHLNHAEGSVAYAPQGDQEWHDVQPRRLLKRGDRLWTDRGSRAELQAGGHALRMDGETQLILENVGETATQLSLTQGSIAATVTRVNPGDSFEVGTPNLAFRARQPGDYRIDVDTRHGVTRVVVLSGSGVVYGEKGEALEVRTGQRLTFRDRNLTRMLQPAFAATDDFDRWAGARKRGEPTVTMPAMTAAAPEKPIPNTVTNGKTIVISGSAASLKQAVPPQSQSRPQPQAQAKAAPPVAPALPQPAAVVQQAPKLLPASPPTLKVAAPVLPPAASVQSAAIPAPSPAQIQAAREQQRLARQRAEDDRQAAARAAAARAEQEKRALAAAEAKRGDERRRAVAAKRAEEERRQLAAKREHEHKRQLAARQAEEEKQKKLAQARRAAEEKRLAAARKAEQQQRLAAEALRRQHLARLQEQARREEQSSVVRRAEAARRADDDRRAEQARREEDARREEQARREEFERRQRALAEQARRDQARRDEEIWLRQQPPQQPLYQPMRPQPMGVPARRIS